MTLRDKQVEELRRLYLEAENDVKIAKPEVLEFRRGVLEGIRRAAKGLCGIVGEHVVAGEKP